MPTLKPVGHQSTNFSRLSINYWDWKIYIICLIKAKFHPLIKWIQILSIIVIFYNRKSLFNRCYENVNIFNYESYFLLYSKWQIYKTYKEKFKIPHVIGWNNEKLLLLTVVNEHFVYRHYVKNFNFSWSY